MGKTSERRLKWERETQYFLTVKFSRLSEQDKIDYLNRQTSKSGYVKALIAKDMAEQK